MNVIASLKYQFFLFLLVLSGFLYETHAKEITTNEVNMKKAPTWLSRTRVEKITQRIQRKLEWSTRKINVHWYYLQADFNKVHKFGPLANAVTKSFNGEISVHLGPKLSDSNFDEIFGHELVHVISLQKYKGSIPSWLEEGLANHLARRGEVDYKWLATQDFPKDVRELAHPFLGSSDAVIYRYKASQALAEMLDKKCKLEGLIRLSVEKKMEDYIKTYCQIKDLSKSFKDWVLAKSR